MIYGYTPLHMPLVPKLYGITNLIHSTGNMATMLWDLGKDSVKNGQHASNAYATKKRKGFIKILRLEMPFVI